MQHSTLNASLDVEQPPSRQRARGPWAARAGVSEASICRLLASLTIPHWGTTGSMKRRRQTKRDQQPQRRAARRQSQRAAIAAAPSAPSAAACAVNTSCATDTSQLTTRSQASIPPLSALQRVGSDVLVLILQCLTAAHKLTAVSPLSRAFHPLPALAFLHDPLRSLLPVCIDEKRTRTGLLLCLQLDLDEPKLEAPGRTTLFTCPRSLRSLPHCAGLKQLQLSLGLPERVDCPASLPCILRSVLSLPSLKTLGILQQDQKFPEADWTDGALPQPASLRHLTLTALSLSAASILRLFSLPLRSLELGHCRVLAGGDDAVIRAEQTAGSRGSCNSLRSLLLPESNDDRRVLQLYVRATQHSSAGLKRLVCSGPLSHALLTMIAMQSQLQQLRELDLTGCIVDLRSGPALDLGPLMTASFAPRLPQLTKLHLGASGIRNRGPGHCNPRLERAFTAACQQLVAAYSAQLTSLTVDVLSAWTLSAWLHLLFGYCRHLAVLGITRLGQHVEAEPPLELQLEPEPAGGGLILAGLKKLRLERLPLSDGGLLSLLSRCPELEVCAIDGLEHVTVAGQEAAFRCCPKLVPEAEWLHYKW